MLAIIFIKPTFGIICFDMLDKTYLNVILLIYDLSN